MLFLPFPRFPWPLQIALIFTGFRGYTMIEYIFLLLFHYTQKIYSWWNSINVNNKHVIHFQTIKWYCILKITAKIIYVNKVTYLSTVEHITKLMLLTMLKIIHPMERIHFLQIKRFIHAFTETLLWTYVVMYFFLCLLLRTFFN